MRERGDCGVLTVTMSITDGAITGIVKGNHGSPPIEPATVAPDGRWAPTGLQDFFPYEKVSDEEYLDSRLKQIGVAPGDIDYVVLSHLHFDHAGNVQAFKETNARLVCSAKEKEWAFGFDGPALLSERVYVPPDLLLPLLPD